MCLFRRCRFSAHLITSLSIFTNGRWCSESWHMPWITAIWIALSAANSAEPIPHQLRSRARPHFRGCVFGAALGTRSANHWICCRKSASSHLGNLPGNQPHDFVKETRNIVFLTMCCAAQNTSPDPRQRPPQGPRPHTPQTPNRDPLKDLDPRDPGPRGTVGAAQRPTERPRPHGPGTPETRDPPRDRDPRDPGPQRPTQRPSP